MILGAVAQTPGSIWETPARGTLTATDRPDTALSGGHAGLQRLGQMAATDGKDGTTVTGTVSGTPPTTDKGGELIVTDGKDDFTATVNFETYATLSGTDGVDFVNGIFGTVSNP